jgi:lipopolysaccharide transport system ATP-binding protein
MSDNAIQVEALGKKYIISHTNGARYATLRETLAHSAATLGRRALRAFRPWAQSQPDTGREEIWALRDVSFDVKQGERLGVIGRNGAGKTTLLRILSRITEPTRGRVTIRGRVASLLEVGTGFHPELTGRENVFLNGAVLGMSKWEISRKFDPIVAFSEVEEFLDTPLKRYSTGMQVRLAFAVAAHLEPEILLVDEVLAVGDLPFQKKCLGQMEELAHGGRTIVFVSHQMNQIRRLCHQVLWVEGGQVRKAGSAGEVVGAYEAAVTSGNSGDSLRAKNGKVTAQFLEWKIAEPSGDHHNTLDSLGPVRLEFTVEVKKPVRRGVHGIGLHSADGQLMWGTAAYNLTIDTGVHQFVYLLPGLPLRPGPYRWRVSLYDDSDLLDAWECLPEMMVCAQPVTHPRDEWAGVLNIPSEFKVEHAG